jgi:hypothetical protein
MRKLNLLFLLVIFVFTSNLLAKQKMIIPQKKRPLIQLAILLDTSNSMDGLINQTKSELWKIVNELASSKRNGVSPNLEVALYEYGNDRLSRKSGYLRSVTGFTSDLDKVSEVLFGLRTSGGDEYCGQVIDVATNDLTWNDSKDSLKIIFIAGNEAFNQGNIDYKTSCKRAIKKGIVVNTIFCGNYDTGISTFWKEGAELADGHYINIDQNAAVVHIDAPQDKKIAELGVKLNKTYIAYGSSGKKAMARQKAQDSNASGLSSNSMAQRAMFKSKSQYKNDSWDLVDAAKDNKKSVKDMSEDELPQEMKKMNKEERVKYVDKKSKERKEIQDEINKLSKERTKYIEKERKKSAISGKDTLDTAIIKAVHELGKKKGFKF